MARSDRLSQPLTADVARFLSSLSFDWRLLGDDVEGSLAHVQMLAQRGIIAGDVAQKLTQGLLEIRRRWEEGTLEPRFEWEDVHMNVEGRLHELVGTDGGYLHTARSRNDQVATDMHLYMRRTGQTLQSQCLTLINAIVSVAERTVDVVMPGYTHMQPAQPIRLAYHWLAYANMFRRDWSRLQDWAKRSDLSPLGAGALAGTPYPTDPEQTGQTLGFAALYQNGLDAVSDRDYLLEFLAWASIFMVHVSRLAEELVLWSTPEFGFVTLPDGFSTGSSIMPQKKNPDVAELLRGKGGRIYGHLMGLLAVVKGLPLAYNSDLQEDKEAVFDTVDTVQSVLSILPGLVHGLSFDEVRLKAAASAQFTLATDLADRLAQTGMPFREAHHRVGGLVRQLLNRGYTRFEEVNPDVWEDVAPDIPYSWIQELRPEQAADARTQPFATARPSVVQQIATLKQWIQGADNSSANPAGG
ncbi:MAG: argininosuccinate lyase [Sulfobacillus acidophilus]|uniref:Argininosuccinate lyase n=1 Tax=Sulfobacillus acidophilus TaxID=53633 RepID=A0A2T2WKP1_9FIRM|nr:MAG: argininosuccinate lyase [Sulfobacillus acidophilus]